MPGQGFQFEDEVLFEPIAPEEIVLHTLAAPLLDQFGRIGF